MSHEHQSADLARDEQVRAHLIVHHGWPRWAAIAFTGEPKTVHTITHQTEDVLEAMDVFPDFRELKSEIIEILVECTQKDISDVIAAAAIVDHLMNGSERFELVQRARRP